MSIQGIDDRVLKEFHIHFRNDDIEKYLNRREPEGYSGGEQYIDLNVLNKDKNLEDLIIR